MFLLHLFLRLSNKIFGISKIISTPTIINSFINKYARVAKINSELMRRLFKFKPVVIGAAINLNGCVIRFHYNFHVIPSIGFEINN